MLGIEIARYAVIHAGNARHLRCLQEQSRKIVLRLLKFGMDSTKKFTFKTHNRVPFILPILPAKSLKIPNSLEFRAKKGHLKGTKSILFLNALI